MHMHTCACANNLVPQTIVIGKPSMGAEEQLLPTMIGIPHFVFPLHGSIITWIWTLRIIPRGWCCVHKAGKYYIHRLHVLDRVDMVTYLLENANGTCTCTCTCRRRAHAHAHATCTCTCHMHMPHAHAHAHAHVAFNTIPHTNWHFSVCIMRLHEAKPCA